MLHELLIEYGLNDKAARVYLALLELETATVNQIAKTSHINRSSTYVVLESLKERGLVHESNDNKIQHYIATSPEVLLRLAEDNSREHEALKRKLEKAVPELKALYRGTKHRPRVRVFEGKQGLINAFEDTLQNQEKKIRISSSVGNLFKALPNYLPQYVKTRRNKGIKMYGIHPLDEAAKILVKLPPINFDEVALIPTKKYNFPADLAIYDDRIAYMSLEGKGTAIVIESKEMAEVMKNVFDLAFAEAKKLSKIKN